jgi:hypothetical protein
MDGIWMDNAAVKGRSAPGTTNRSETHERAQVDSWRPQMKVYAIAIPRWAFLSFRFCLVKAWLRDCSVHVGGIQAKAPALHRAHLFLYVATKPFRHRSGGLRGDARDRAERQTHQIALVENVTE